jgi:putative endonuclease
VSAWRQAIGKWGENQAANFLEQRGFRILDRNARTPYGEIDLVACQESEGRPPLVVFVEVKTRTTREYGRPEQAVTARKQTHLLAAIQAYLLEHPELEGDWRVDVIAIYRNRRGADPEINLFENALF